MAIEKLVSAPNGAPLAYHQVNKLTVDYPVFGDAAPKVYTQVLSWKDYNSYENKESIAWQWSLDGVLDVTQFAEPEEGLVDNPRSPFNGGVVVDYTNPTKESASLKKLLEISKLYNEKNDAPMSTPFGEIDGDDASKAKITQTVTFWQLLGRLGQAPETIQFTRKDNTQVEVTSQQLDVIGAMLGAREQELRAIRNSLREAVAQAQTVEEIQAIQWPFPVMGA
jgi:hypothetical protein